MKQCKGLVVKPSTQKTSSNNAPSPKQSNDGYIRIKYIELENICFHHLESNLDTSEIHFPESSGDITEITGYTEWVSDTTPTLSIGWDWRYIPSQSTMSYEIVGLPFSNILIQNSSNKDFSENTSLELLSQFISSWGWQEVVSTYIAKKYK